MARVEAERRGYRRAEVVIGMGDGGNRIDPLFDRASRSHAGVIDWYHAAEHVWDCATATTARGRHNQASGSKRRRGMGGAATWPLR